MQSREFQERQIDATIEAIERYRTVLVQLPTGGGKTVEFSLITKKFLNKLIDIEHGPVLILVHREELLYQTERAVKEVLGFDPCLITSTTSRYWISRVYIGMVESTLSRLHMILNPSLIIIDECHIQNFNKVHKHFPTAKILGFSATPISASKKEPMKKYYESIVVGPSIKDLINQGFLSQNITRAPASSVDTSGFDYDRLINDYNQRQVATVYRMSKNVENCINNYFKYCLNKKTLIFNVNIEHSKEVNECFNACGYPSRHLDATSPDRKEIFHWFKTTKNAILNSVMIPTMGFDEPTVQSVILNFSTLSLVKFIQTCGRGSRIIDEYFIEKFHSEYPYELELKDHFDIIDLGANWRNFGDWNDERDWRYIFWNPDSPGEGIAPVKSCPSCESLVHAAVRLCPYCGHEFEKRAHKQIDMEEMILITKGIDIDSLSERSQKKYEYYPMYDLATDIVNNMFYIHGDNPSQFVVDKFFRTYYGLCCEWYKRTLGQNPDKIDDIVDSGWHIRKARSNFNALILKKNKNATTIKDETPFDLVHKDYPNNIKERESLWKEYKQINLT